jgi:hypothetical protein
MRPLRRRRAADTAARKRARAMFGRASDAMVAMTMASDRTRNAHYSLDVDNLKDFAAFLRDSGSFSIY